MKHVQNFTPLFNNSFLSVDQLISLILWLDHSGLLRDVEAVQELPDVLVLDVSGLLDEGGGLRDGLHGVPGQDQLVLLAFAVLTGHTGVHAHLPDVLLSEEVPDLNESSLLTDGAVDGEMSVHSPHLVHEAHSDSLDHVLDVATDSSDGRQLFLLSEPLLDLEGALVDHVDVHCQVTELLLQGAPGSLHRDLAGLHRHVHLIGDSHHLGTVNILHFRTFSCRSESSNISLVVAPGSLHSHLS